jgi:spore germination protein
MKHHSLLLFLSMLFCTATGFGQTKSENLFYMVDTPESFESFKNHLSQISIVCPQSFVISKDGVLSGSVDRRVLELSKANGIKVMPLFVNPGFNTQLLHDIVSNPAARRRSIDMMLAYARQYGLDGWQFDLEGLHINDREHFTQYYRETADALHKAGLQLSAAVVHMFENVGGPGPYQRFLYEGWRAGYDFKVMSEVGDFLSIMTYDQHTRRTPPGPVAGPAWMEQVVKYLLAEGVKPSRLSLGIPNYSVHWFADYTEEKGGHTTGRQLGYTMVQHLLGRYNVTPVWNEMANCHYAVWDNGGVYEYMFIEDGRSLKPKLDLLKKYKLRGISVWVLGREATDFWDVLKQGTTRQ